MRIRLLEAVESAHVPERPDWTWIAAELDYSTQFYFVNDFKRVVGVFPSKYAKAIAQRIRAKT